MGPAHRKLNNPHIVANQPGNEFDIECEPVDLQIGECRAGNLAIQYFEAALGISDGSDQARRNLVEDTTADPSHDRLAYLVARSVAATRAEYRLPPVVQ